MPTSRKSLAACSFTAANSAPRSALSRAFPASSAASAEAASRASATIATSGSRRTACAGSMSISTVRSPAGRSGQRDQASSSREPMPSSTSVPGHRRKPAAQVNPYGSSSSTMPLPPRKETTGDCSSRASAATSAAASRAPLPTMIIGFAAPAITSAARATAAWSRDGGRTGTGGTSSAGALAARTSHGTAIAVGRGRPDLAWYRARAVSSPAWPGCSTVAAHLVTDRMVASWSGSSCRWPRPRPMNREGISPVMQSTGMLAP